MTTVTIHEAKTHMSRLLARVEQGEEFIIARGRVEVARLVPIKPPVESKRELGWLAHENPDGIDPLAYGFWKPLDDAEIGAWEGRNERPDDAAAA